MAVFPHPIPTPKTSRMILPSLVQRTRAADRLLSGLGVRRPRWRGTDGLIRGRDRSALTPRLGERTSLGGLNSARLRCNAWAVG